MRQHLATDVLASKIPLQHGFDCKVSICIQDPVWYPSLIKQGKLFSTRKEILLLDQHAQLQIILKSTEPGTLSCLPVPDGCVCKHWRRQLSLSRQKCLASLQLPQRGVSGIVQTLPTTRLCEPVSGRQLSFHWSGAALVTNLHSFVGVFFINEAFFFNPNVHPKLLLWEVPRKQEFLFSFQRHK